MTCNFDRIKTVTDYETSEELTFDTLSGEVLATRKVIIKKHQITTDVGSQCRHPVAARTDSELAEILSVHDQWLDNLSIEAEKLLDLMEACAISSGAVKSFRGILRGLAGRNLWFGKLADMGTKREISELARAGLIRVTRQGKTLPTKVAVHPWYGWRGDLSSRQTYIDDWIGLAASE